ncbi:hypothetical protein C1X05_08705 [Laceyella sacchari]|jgi:DNA-binding MarR family transcriptional regulator|uniref:Transcriptional regulator, MarR family n=2 Tax=Laceyella TaxID=292635 RepID=A0AA45WNE7_9BACL|nr:MULTISPECIES: MarR family transcriptional regulator [Laceyella]AUS08917.1 hypothetical protein C1X05_08705 [Laceyella sacchari]PRZ15308.1 MarR family transcriptional regulator [Laceyella sediminis]SMP18410.1 transcriptional regulator, MarR family [Laceyella tengchongensis]
MDNLFENNVGKYTSIIWRHVQLYLAQRLESFGIGSGQYNYLFALYENDGQSQQKLSELLLVNKSATVKAINKLEELGFVERRVNQEDKRYYHVYLTSKGWSVMPQLKKIVAEVQEELFRGMSDEERTLLLRLMRKMAHNITTTVRQDCNVDS